MWIAIYFEAVLFQNLPRRSWSLPWVINFCINAEKGSLQIHKQEKGMMEKDSYEGETNDFNERWIMK